MWKKKMQMSRSREPRIGAPTLVNTTLDQSILQYISGNPSPAGQKNESKDLPALPTEAIESTAYLSNKRAEPRVTSSIYSRDDSNVRTYVPSTYVSHEVSPIRNNWERPRYTVPDDHSDISPPDSPVEVGRAQRPGSPDISPISDGPKDPFGLPMQKTRFDSQLPVPGKGIQLVTPSRQRVPSSSSAWQSLRSPASLNPEKQRRNDVSVEPTTEISGKMGLATLGDGPFQGQVEPKSGRQSSGFLGTGKEKFQAGKIFLKGRDPSNKDKQQPQEPWKGASGRSPMVKPIESNPNTRKPNRPTERDNRDQSPSSLNDFSFTNHQARTITTISAGESHDDQKAKKRGTGQNKTKVTQQSTGRKLPQEAIANSSQIETPRVSENPVNVPTRRTNDTRFNETVPGVDYVGSTLSSQFQDLDIFNQPGSRFSATTYATTEAGLSPPDSPRANVDPDAPAVPAVPASVMSRKRPVASATNLAKSTTRKPTPSTIPAADTETSKDLPQSPPTAQAQTLIDKLQAKQKELAIRKQNIDTIIYELTQVIQPSPIAYDMATKAEVKRTVTSLNHELDDIKKQEHDIGLRLLRAWKKLDRNGEFEPSSSLWVKRVTS